jgi:hypothetical protein
MAKFMHQKVFNATRATMGAIHYVALDCDEVSTMDNKSWLSIYYYVMQKWVRIPILIFLDRMVERLGNDNLTKTIKGDLMIGGGLLKDQIV